MKSTTIKGALVALATGGLLQILPQVLPVFGFTQSQDVAIMAGVGALGTVWAGVQVIIGRFKASGPLR